MMLDVEGDPEFEGAWCFQGTSGHQEGPYSMQELRCLLQRWAGRGAGGQGS
jgi:hypothetical protein